MEGISDRLALHGTEYGGEHHASSLPALTGVRFVAAAMVFLFHYGASFANNSGVARPVVTLLKNGYLGVSIFFILSGFIISYNYAGRPAGKNGIADFMIARVARIYPVYLLVLLVALPLAWDTLDGRKVVLVLMMLQSWTVPSSLLGQSWVTPAWTLSVECFFYLCSPALILLTRKLTLSGELACAAAMALVIVVLWTPMVSPGQTLLSFHAVAYIPIPVLRLFEFTYGAMLCRLFLRVRHHAPWFGSTAAVLPVTATIIGLLTTTHAGEFISLAMVIAGVLLVQLAIGRSVLALALSTRAMGLLGGASYALYLLQNPVRGWLHLFPSLEGARLVNPIAALSAAVIVYLYWEEPARRLLRRTAYTLIGAARGFRPLQDRGTLTP